MSTDQISDYDGCVREYHASRARYIRTVTADTEKRLMETYAKRRDPIKLEITNLSSLAKVRFETRQMTLKAYAAKAPSRVGAGGLLPPGPSERMIGGIDKLYKSAVKAAEEFNEVNEILKKRKEKLDSIDNEVRTVIEQHARDLIAALETPTGLEGAFKRDPLLERAHSRMVAAEARRAAIRDASILQKSLPMTDERDELGSYGELLPGKPGFDEALAQGEYDFAKTRFVRTLTGDGVARVVEHAAARRAKLRAEIDQLRTLVRVRHEAAVEHARAYALILPHRVGKTWIQPPGQLEKVGQFYGSVQFYKRAEKAAKEYVEIRDILVKRREQLVTMENDLRTALDEREAALIRQMESPRGLQSALQRDPLLNNAYQKLKALREELKTAPDGIGDI